MFYCSQGSSWQAHGGFPPEFSVIRIAKKSAVADGEPATAHQKFRDGRRRRPVDEEEVFASIAVAGGESLKVRHKIRP